MPLCEKKLKLVSSTHKSSFRAIPGNPDEIYMPIFNKPLWLFGRGYALRYRFFYTCAMSSLYTAAREQPIYGSETRQLSKNACDPDMGKYGRGRETTDEDRKIVN